MGKRTAGGFRPWLERACRANGATFQIRRYVCLCASSNPFPPISVIQKKLNPRQGVLDSDQEYTDEQFETTWGGDLQAGCCNANAGADTLLFYDGTGRFVDHSEGDRLMVPCQSARLVKTHRYGHLAILSAPELAQATGAFLQSPGVDRATDAARETQTGISRIRGPGRRVRDGRRAAAPGARRTAARRS